jgi:flagellar protein FliO/FliZ
MRLIKYSPLCLLLSLMALPVIAADGVVTKPFAAPAAATSLPSSNASSLGQVTLALLLVLAAVFLAAWFMRRLRTIGSAGQATIEVVSQVALGARERAVIVKVGQTHLLLGVAPGRVNLLQQLPEGSVPTADKSTAAPAGPDFASLLRKSLGR